MFADPYKGLVEDSDPDEGEEESEETKIQKYKSLVRDLEESEKQKEDRGVEMEITWEPGKCEATCPETVHWLIRIIGHHLKFKKAACFIYVWHLSLV